jgi:beta-lactam-binding protein with PASTA domain
VIPPPKPKYPWKPFAIAAGAGFVLSYLIVAIFVFPAGAAQRDVLVPNVVGMTFTDAQRQLEAATFTVQRGESRSNNAPRGTVIDQQPEAATSTSPGIRVTLVVSNGPKLSTVPAVIGMSREQALSALEGAGFTVGDVSERASNEPRGAIIDSRPRPGSSAPTPSPVSLVMSAGPTTIVVPDLVGRPVAEATQLLRQVGLTLGEIRGPGAMDAAAVVQSQIPASGSQVTAGTKVDLITGGRTP